MTNKPVCPLCSEGHLTETLWFKDNCGEVLTWVSSMCNHCGVEQTSSEQMAYNQYLNKRNWRDIINDK